MTEVTRAITALIGAALAPALKTSGYTRHGNRFHRTPNPDCIQVVEVQTSRQRSGEFTINLGVWPRPMQELMDWQPKRTLPEAHECAIRERIGQLLTPPHDRWWHVGSESERSAIAVEVRRAWITAGAPFHDSLTSWAASREHILRHQIGLGSFYIHLIDRDFRSAVSIFEREIAANPNHAYVAPRAVAAANRVGLALEYPLAKVSP